MQQHLEAALAEAEELHRSEALPTPTIYLEVAAVHQMISGEIFRRRVPPQFR